MLVFCRDLPPPTLAPGCSIDIAMGFDISQRPGTFGEMLISGHPSLQTFLPEIVHYVSSIKGLCCAGPTPIKTNIAFRVVRRDGSILYDFNFEPYSADVVNKVMTVSLAEPTYFNAALLKSFREKFTKSGAGVKVRLTQSLKGKKWHLQVVWGFFPLQHSWMFPMLWGPVVYTHTHNDCLSNYT